MISECTNEVQMSSISLMVVYEISSGHPIFAFSFVLDFSRCTLWFYYLPQTFLIEVQLFLPRLIAFSILFIFQSVSSSNSFRPPLLHFISITCTLLFRAFIITHLSLPWWLKYSFKYNIFVPFDNSLKTSTIKQIFHVCFHFGFATSLVVNMHY